MKKSGISNSATSWTGEPSKEEDERGRDKDRQDAESRPPCPDAPAGSRHSDKRLYDKEEKR